MEDNNQKFSAEQSLQRHSVDDSKGEAGCGKQFILSFALGLADLYCSPFEFRTNEIYQR
jgi:hypothetical protein